MKKGHIISIKAKDLAAEMTRLNIQKKDLKEQNSIEKEHMDNSAAIRNMLLERGIHPKNLPVAGSKKICKR
jgi:DNA-damage-inducible protein D